MAAALTAPPQSQPGWFSRNWKWLVLTLILVVVVLPLAFCGGMFFLIINTQRHFDFVQESLARARANPVVIQKLGTPIELGWIIEGSINQGSINGDIDVAIPISGPKSKATIYSVGHKASGRWTYSRMEVEFPGEDRRVNLMPQVEEQ